MNTTKNRSAGIIERNTLGEFLLEIVVGPKADYYIASEIPSDFGRGFRLEKQQLGSEKPEAIYHVNIGADYPTCDCRGAAVAKNGCKHQLALTALTKAGRLPPARGELVANVTTYTLGRPSLRPEREDDETFALGKPVMRDGRAWDEFEQRS